MRIRDLECFIGVCEVGSLNRAAERLHIAQPALGVLVRRLEDEFGAPLIVRDSRGVRPTREGEEVAAWSREVLDGRRRLAERVRSASPRTGSLSLGFSPSAAALQALRSLIVAETSGGLPALRLVEDASHVLIESVIANTLDVALSYDMPAVGGTETAPLASQPLYLVGASGAFVEGEVVTLAQVLDTPLIMGPPSTSVRFVVEAAARRAGGRARIVQELTSLSLRRHVVERGLAETVLPLPVVRGDVEAGRLSAARIVEPELTRTLSLIRKSGWERTEEEEALVRLIAGTLRVDPLQVSH